MRKWFSFFRILGTARVRALALLTGAVFAAISSVGIATYYVSRNMIIREIQQPQYLLLQIDKHNIEALYWEMDEASLRVFSNYNTRTEYYLSDFRRLQARVRMLSDLTTTAIDSIYLYDLEQDALTASLPHGHYSNTALFEDSGWMYSAPELLGEDNRYLHIRTILRDGREVQMITLYRKLMSGTRLTGYVVVNAAGSDFFANIDFDTQTNRMILDEEGSIVYLSSDLENPSIFLENRHVIEEAESGSIQLDGNSFLLTRLSSAATGWTFYSFVPMDEMLSEVRIVRNVILTLSLFSVLIGVVSIIHTSFQLYHPIKRIEILLKETVSDAKDLNLDAIEALTENLLLSHSDLAQSLERERQMVKAKFLEDLVREKIGPAEMRRQWPLLFEGWRGEGFCIAILSIDSYYNWKAVYSLDDEYLLKYAIGNIVDEILGESFHLVRFSDAGGCLVYLLQLRWNASFINNNMERLFEHVIHTVHCHLKISISFGISDYRAERTEIPRLYLQAEQALLSRFYQGYGNVHFSQALPMEDCGKERFLDDRTLDTLQTAIHLGNMESACGILRNSASFFRGNRTNPVLVLDYYRRVIDLMEEWSAQNGVQLELDTSAVDSMCLEDMETQLLEILTEWMTAKGKGTRSARQVEQMIQYMMSEYERDISIGEIASASGLSASAASSIFKQETGRTMYEYLTEIRMETACELLVNTDLTIAEIAKQSGYQNETSFRRAFKKTKHIAPKEYKIINIMGGYTRGR